MSVYASTLVKKAISQIGTKEGKNNANKYGKAYGWDNVAWCVIFIWWLFMSCGASRLFYDGKKTASCTAVYKWAKAAGLLVNKYNAKAGDLVLFKFSSNPPDHIGIVESAGASRLVTIEGNTSSGNSGSQSNGDGVYRRYRSYSQVYAVIRPKYDAEKKGSETVNVTLPLLKQGSAGASVRTLQTLLNAKGYNCGKVDGDFGPGTTEAVYRFQKAAGLTADKEVGRDTWTQLLTK